MYKLTAVSPDNHRRLKTLAAVSGQTMQAHADRAIGAYLDRLEKRSAKQ